MYQKTDKEMREYDPVVINFNEFLIDIVPFTHVDIYDLLIKYIASCISVYFHD